MTFSKPTTIKELEALVDMVIEEDMDETEFKDDLLKKFGIKNYGHNRPLYSYKYRLYHKNLFL
jgi:hypothetical protein